MVFIIFKEQYLQQEIILIQIKKNSKGIVEIYTSNIEGIVSTQFAKKPQLYLINMVSSCHPWSVTGTNVCS